MLRNPWGTVSYNGSLSSSDMYWKNPQILGQVPFGVNPITDGVNYGIFIVPVQDFSGCLSDY